MANPKPNPETSLRKLGERIREGSKKEHDPTEKQLRGARDAVRQDWDREQAAKRVRCQGASTTGGEVSTTGAAGPGIVIEG
jgi:hypothetical protein